MVSYDEPGGRHLPLSAFGDITSWDQKHKTVKVSTDKRGAIKAAAASGANNVKAIIDAVKKAARLTVNKDEVLTVMNEE